MLLKPLVEPETDEPFQMTAMVDVVFILLTFFIVSSRFVGLEHDLGLPPDQQVLAQGAQEDDFPRTVQVQLRVSGADHVRITLGKRDLGVDAFDRITQTLEQINLPRVPVVVRAESAVRVQALARVIDSVLASPMSNVRMGKLEAER